MIIELRFVHLEVAEDTRMALEDRIRDQFSDFEKQGREFKVSVSCSTEASRQETHGPTFKCHATMHAPWLTKDLHVEMKGFDSQSLIHSCCFTLKGQAIRQLDKRVKSKRQAAGVRASAVS